MRVTLKHLLPLALLLGNVIAATETGSGDEGTTAVEPTDEATSTGKVVTTATGKNTGTATVTSGAKGTGTATGTKATGKATATDEGDSTATNTDDSEEATTATVKTTTAQRFNTDEWVPTIPATSAPDLNAGSSMREPGLVGLSVAVGLVTVGMTFL